jgi:hypothetical protein
MRDLLIEKMYEWSKIPYQKFIKKGTPWNLSTKQLIEYEQDSLGFHLGCFLLKYNFEIQPKLEDHDVFHVITNTGITVQDEIAMQYFLLGNGKRSAYLFMVITIGTCFYPRCFSKFKEQYNRGKIAHRLHDINFIKMLSIPVETIQSMFNIKY